MDTITVWICGRYKDGDTPTRVRMNRPGFPYYTKSVVRVSKKLTFTGRAAELMRDYKRHPEEDFNRAGVVADYLEDHPEEADKPVLLGQCIACLREMFTERKLAHQLGY